MNADASTKSRRTKGEIEALDEQIRPLYESGLGCRAVGAKLGEDPAMIYKRVRAMGLSRTRYETRQVAPSGDVPFTAEPHDHNLRTAAVGDAVSWFLRRGCTPGRFRWPRLSTTW
jgi:hypothetical protein